MAIVEMKKLKLVGLSKEKELILDTINKLKCVELKTPEEIEGTHTRLNVKRQSEALAKIGKLDFALNFIKEQQLERVKTAKTGEITYQPPKKPLFSVRDDIAFDDFISIQSGEYEIFAKVEELSRLNGQISEIKSEETRIKNQIAQLKPFEELKVEVSEIADTKNTVAYFGTIPSQSKQIFERIGEIELAAAEVISEVGSGMTVAVFSHKSVAAEVFAVLTECGYVKFTSDLHGVPMYEINKLNRKLEELKIKAVELNGTVCSYEGYLSDFKKMHDYYKFKLDKIEAQGDFRRTAAETSFSLEGWVAVTDVEFFQREIAKVTNAIYVEFTDVEEGDNPPTLAKNNKLVAPFESVTNMYSAPSYFENDPSSVVTFFFILFFGFMLSDAGYGLILAVGAFVLLKCFKLEKGMRDLVTVIMFGGISTIMWGLLFGGVFSIEIEGTFLEKLCVVKPLEEPLTVLILALVLGLIQILVGLFMKAKQLIQDGHVVDAFCDVGSWYLVFGGLILYILSMIGFESLAQIGIYVAVAGVAVLILTQGRHEKGIIKKLFKGITSLYGAVNYVSDILSYSRLFGLGLATGVVGMVFNSIAALFIDLLGYFVGIPIAVIFILFGHALNIGINTLGAYVHNCRLQYIEFFSRFYTGGGHVFVPFGSKTKYVNVINNK